MATQEMVFNKGALDKAAHQGGGATRYRDARYPNLYLEVGVRSKTWRYRKFYKGRNFTETLGTWPQMTVIEAAQTAAEINIQIEEAGIVVKDKRPRGADEITLREALEQHVTQALDPRQRKISEQTADGYASVLRLHVPRWLDCPSSDDLEHERLILNGGSVLFRPRDHRERHITGRRDLSEVLNLVHLPDGRVVNETGADPAIPRVTGFVRYFVGADLGQSNDYSSAVVVKDQQLPVFDGNRVTLGARERTVVFADKFRGVSYVDVCDYLIRLRNAPPFGGKSELVIDGTSIGRVVSDVLTDQGVDHTAITMTGGQDWNRKGRYVNASKTLMIENLAVLFAAGELKFAHDLPLRQEIEEDLGSFTTQTTAAGNMVISQSRNASGHGDLGIGLICAAFASQYLAPQSIKVSRLRGWY